MSSASKRPAAKWEENSVEVGEYELNVASSGSGPTLILLHGEERRPSWKDWEGFSDLSDRYRMVVPDLVGYGKSSRPSEIPDHRAQAQILHELLDAMRIGTANFAGYSWGGQVALEFAINWPTAVESLILVASTYDKSQIPELSKVQRPTLVVWAEDDLVTQLKAGYLLRDAIRTSRLEVLPPVAKDPKYDYRIAHRLLESRRTELEVLFRSFLASPSQSTEEPPDIEKELRGMALKHETPKNWGSGKSA